MGYSETEDVCVRVRFTDFQKSYHCFNDFRLSMVSDNICLAVALSLSLSFYIYVYLGLFLISFSLHICFILTDLPLSLVKYVVFTLPQLKYEFLKTVAVVSLF